MIITEISIENEGFMHCKSEFYTAHDSLVNSSNYTFKQGINRLNGEIDSGNWAISYLLSMYKHRPNDCVLFRQPNVYINKKCISLNEFSDFSCYMDRSYPLFSTNDSVKDIISEGVKNHKTNYSCDEIEKLFHIDGERFVRPLASVGNEIFKAMSAIGFTYEKEVFCFPWLSLKRFEGFHENLTHPLSVLSSLGKTVILPVGTSG